MKLPPYVQMFRDRHGKARLYFRKAGLPRVALPNPATDRQAFLRAYQTALTAPPRIALDGAMFFVMVSNLEHGQ